MSVDFNNALFTGVAALLDSSAPAIQVGTLFFHVFQVRLPGNCRRSAERTYASLTCDCESVEEFPTITFSFEASSNVRFMGLDFGADFLVCMPPSAYVRKKPKANVCFVQIVDGGKQFFGVESMVLGVPFFRSATVAYDAERQQVAIGPLPSEESVGPACVCTDPKNWWDTGKRLSSKRIVLSLVLVAGILAYVFTMHSHSSSAQMARGFVDIILVRTTSVRDRAGQRLGEHSSIQVTDRRSSRRSRQSDSEDAQQEDHVQSDFVPLYSDAES